MQAELIANAAASTLNGAINSSVTSLTVSSATTFPTGTGVFRILIDSEIMIVTGVSGATFTVTRGAENTTAASHSNAAGVTHIITKDSSRRLSEQNFALGTRAIAKAHTVKVENDTYTAGQTKTVCNLSGLGPGYISSMWMAMNGSTAAAREQSVFSLYRDGGGTPDISMWMAQLHGGLYGPAAYNSRWMGWVPTGSYMNRFTAPFTDGFKITVTNGDVSNSSQLYMVINYCLTQNQWDWGRMARLKAYGQNLAPVTKYSDVTLIDILGRGLLFGIYQVFSNSTDHDFHFAEGNHKFFIDGEGSASLEWSGTEDYYENANYWTGGVLIGESTGTVVKNTTDVGSYRFHHMDPIMFDTELNIVWTCGNASEATMANNLNNMIYTVYYYLDQ